MIERTNVDNAIDDLVERTETLVTKRVRGDVVVSCRKRTVVMAARKVVQRKLKHVRVAPFAITA